jgi:hypothetical protein
MVWSCAIASCSVTAEAHIAGPGAERSPPSGVRGSVCSTRSCIDPTARGGRRSCWICGTWAGLIESGSSGRTRLTKREHDWIAQPRSCTTGVGPTTHARNRARRICHDAPHAARAETTVGGARAARRTRPEPINVPPHDTMQRLSTEPTRNEGGAARTRGCGRRAGGTAQ